MTDVYARAAKSATRLLGVYGFAAEMITTLRGEYDPVQGRYDASQQRMDSIRVALFDKRPDKRDGGDDVIDGDKKAYLSAEGIAPMIGAKVLTRLDTYNIVGVETLAPAGNAVLYTLHLRRA